MRCEKQIEKHILKCEHTIKISCYINVTAKNSQCNVIYKEIFFYDHIYLQKCENYNVKINRQIIQRNYDACQNQCN